MYVRTIFRNINRLNSINLTHGCNGMYCWRTTRTQQSDEPTPLQQRPTHREEEVGISYRPNALELHGRLVGWSASQVQFGRINMNRSFYRTIPTECKVSFCCSTLFPVFDWEWELQSDLSWHHSTFPACRPLLNPFKGQLN
jgi:hypothetical protein